jgi:flagellar biogenesis protein FliO
MVLFLLAGQRSVYAQSTQPGAPAPSVYDGQMIRRITVDGPGGVVRTSTSTAPSTAASTAAPTSLFDWQRLLIAMALVLGLIAIFRYFVVKIFPTARASASTSAVRVLARAPLAVRQQVVLIQVGRRVIVVGDSAGQLTALSQIDDPDEVAALLGQIENTPPAASVERFSSLFRKQRQPFNNDFNSSDVNASAPVQQNMIAEADASEPQMQTVQSEVSGLIERMRSLTKSMKQ